MKLSFYDPQNDPRLIDYITTKCIANKILPYNFYSLLDFNLGFRADNLYPDKSLFPLLNEEMNGDGTSLAFDQAYCNQILTNEKSFMDLMTILYSIQVIDETMVISNYTNRGIMPIIDSLIKFIQERYGIDAFIINELEDIDEFKFSHFESLEQEAVFMKDCERYARIAKIPIITANQNNISNTFDQNLAHYDMQRFGII